MEKRTKRYYKVGEMVWVVGEKKEGKVLSINRESLEVTVSVKEDSELVEHTLKMWEIDKLKYKAKEKLSQKKQGINDKFIIEKLLKLVNSIMYPEVYFAKLRDGAKIPSKRDEDAGLDIYVELSDYKRETDEGVIYEIECPVNKTTLVPTGLAVAMPKTHYLNLKHERGSTAVQSISVLAGVVDSGFRNEMFVAITPLKKSVIITNTVDKVEENDTNILYPLSKAIAQGTIDLVPKSKISEITYDKLKNIESERGMTMLGQSGK